jgi:hypothetical protein
MIKQWARITDSCNYCSLPQPRRRADMLWTILIIVLILMLVGAMPRWSHSRSWGYAPSGGVGLVVLVLVVLLLSGRI